jgi:hypothetical protein
MKIRKLINLLAIFVVLGLSLIELHAYLTLPQGSYMMWDQVWVFDIPLYGIVLLLLTNNKLSGRSFAWILMAAAISLGLYAYFEGAVLITGITLFALIGLFFANRQIKSNKIVSSQKVGENAG